MGYEFKNEEERKLYEDKLEEYNKTEAMYKRELDNILAVERDMALELELMAKLLERAANNYKNSSNVRKKKITKLLFSNIYIDNKKRLTILVNPNL